MRNVNPRKAMLVILAVAALMALFVLAGCDSDDDDGMMEAVSYEVTVTNNLSEELFAPIVVTHAHNDHLLFDGDNYVTEAAEHQILTGEPNDVLAAIGEGAVAGQGTDGPPGILLAPGKSVTITFDAETTALRILAMVAPTLLGPDDMPLYPDNYVSAAADVPMEGSVTVPLSRFDIGYDEMTMDNTRWMDIRLVAENAGTVTITQHGGAVADDTMMETTAFQVMVTNDLSEELFAPIVVTRANDEHYLFDGTYVTDAAKDQILTGSPAMVVASIGEDDTAVGRGSAGPPPGVLLPSGESVSIMFDTDATALRIIAMVAPPMAPDNYVSAVVNVANLRSGSVTVPLSRFDIGDNEMTMEISRVDDHMTVGTVTITRKTGPLGAVAVSEDEAVQIRSLLAHTISSLGTASRYGVELAVQDFGMIHGRAVELGERVDGMCGPEGGRAGADQIVADPQVVGVIGTNCSGAAVTASPVISEAGLVMVSPSNTSPFLTSDLAGNANPNYHPGYFRVDVNDLYKGRAVADFAYDELNLRRTAAIDDGDPYTTALVSAFADAFRPLGGEIVATARIQKGRTDMTSVLTQFATAGPDGIFFPLFEVEGIPFAQQARAFDGLEGVTLISGAALFISQFLGMPQSQGLYFVSPETELGSNVNEATGKNADAVRTAYEAMYDGSPGSPYWAQSYDATALLLSAIESVAVKEGRMLYIDRAALRDELGMTSDFQALIGVLSCDEFGDCGTGHINIHHHTDSSITDPAQVQVVYRFAP